MAATVALRTKERASLRDVTAFALGVFAFSIPFDELFSIPGIGSPTRLVGLAAVAVGLIALLDKRYVRLKQPLLFVVLAAAFVLWNVATYFWSYQPAATLGEASRYVQLLVFVWLMSEFCRSRHRQLNLMQAFVLGNYVAFGITAYNVLIVSTGFRDVGPFNANQFSVILALGVPMAAMLIVAKRPPFLHSLNVVYLFIATFGVVMAASRTGLIVGLIALAVVPLALSRLSLIRRLALFVAAVGAVTFSFWFAPQLFPNLVGNIERLEGTGDELTGGTLTNRTTIWRETITVFRESPVIGIGSGATRFALADTAIARVMAVHNAYLSVAASTGLVGLLLFVGIVGLATAAAFLGAPDLRPFLVTLAAALIVAMVPANSEARKDTWFVLGLLAVQRPIVLSMTVPLDRNRRHLETSIDGLGPQHRYPRAS